MRDHYCYHFIDTKRLMDDPEAVETCSHCGASVRITWRTDDNGTKWNRYEYSGRDGVLW